MLPSVVMTRQSSTKDPQRAQAISKKGARCQHLRYLALVWPYGRADPSRKDNGGWRCAIPALSVSVPLVLLVLLLVFLIYAVRSANEPTREQLKFDLTREPEDVQTTLKDLGGITEAEKALRACC